MAQRFCKICSGWHSTDEPWPEACAAHYASKSKRESIQIIKDIEPYRSTITREVIGGRKQHRDHLRAHRCIEIGNEKQKPYTPPDVGGLGQDIKRAMEQTRGR